MCEEDKILQVLESEEEGFRLTPNVKQCFHRLITTLQGVKMPHKLQYNVFING